MKTKTVANKPEFINPFVLELNKTYSSAISSYGKMLQENEELQRRIDRGFERLNRISIFFEGRR